ncbi:hypothetical protein C8Q70DRAFT_982556 [Cubamyces menziesii]|nr:hypothetical protein C8Q70DRAFT_982556 [Cubamyces menziesii]
MILTIQACHNPQRRSWKWRSISPLSALLLHVVMTSPNMAACLVPSVLVERFVWTGKAHGLPRQGLRKNCSKVAARYCPIRRPVRLGIL